MDLDDLLSVAMEAARAGGEMLKEPAKSNATHEKSAFHLVTEADLKAEAAILQVIRERRPMDAILSEESLSQSAIQQSAIWIVDPLDGTTNFAHGVPQFGTSVAFASNGQVLVGVVYDPEREELFWAQRGKGAFLNGQSIRVSSTPTLQQSLIATGFYYDRGEMMKRTLRAIEDLFTHGIQGIRRFGSAALDLSWVAAGRFDGFFEYQLAPWDYAAGWLLVEEAGGRCCDREGATFHLAANHVVASNDLIHSSLRDQVRYSRT